MRIQPSGACDSRLRREGSYGAGVSASPILTPLPCGSGIGRSVALVQKDFAGHAVRCVLAVRERGLLNVDWAVDHACAGTVGFAARSTGQRRRYGGSPLGWRRRPPKSSSSLAEASPSPLLSPPSSCGGGGGGGGGDGDGSAEPTSRRPARACWSSDLPVSSMVLRSLCWNRNSGVAILYGGGSSDGPRAGRLCISCVNTRSHPKERP